MKVRNINGTSQNTCSCGSWLKHWENHSHQKAGFCSSMYCGNKATDGAHVQKDTPYDRSWYIIPLCRSCNTRFGQELDVFDNTVLVSAVKD
jgi:hypothetical protein